jgi:16S rRNA (guanine527-N7)-methyltransferase
MLNPYQIGQFKEICSSFGINPSAEMMEKFQEYMNLLLEWNERIHLISKNDAKTDRILRHFVDSLSIFKVVDIPKGANLLDLGSGAGFPATPIKIVRDDIQATLVESVHKKTLFLQKLSQVLGLERIRIVNQRAEQILDQPNFKESFDLVTSKALGRLQNTIGLSIPFLKTGGFLIAYKGKSAKREIKEIFLLKDGRIREVAKIEVPSMDLFRWLVIIDKVS